MTPTSGGSDPAICVWWIGAGAAPDALLEEVCAHVERVFGLNTRPWRGRERPPQAFDPVRGQHSSTRILEWLQTAAPAGARKVLAVTDVDLFIPILTFVFGEAQLGGRAAVVSTARLEPREPAASRLFTVRLAKEAVHELGHSFGLVHCDDLQCVMSRSASLLDVDAKRSGLCPDCWSRYLDLRDHPGGTHE